MRSPDEIKAMADRLGENIRAHGFEASVSAAEYALEWALGNFDDATLERWMTRSDAERRREWIARGGDPQHWPDEDPSDRLG